MNREIRFRAWFVDGERKTMDGQIMSYPDERTLSQFLNDVEDAKHDYGYEAILMQYTGLKDSEGTEIYEGDIVSIRLEPPDYPDCCDTIIEHIAEVKFESGCFWFNSDGWCDCLHFHYNADQRTVIGNIYESPGLMDE